MIISLPAARRSIEPGYCSMIAASTAVQHGNLDAGQPMDMGQQASRAAGAAFKALSLCLHQGLTVLPNMRGRSALPRAGWEPARDHISKSSAPVAHQASRMGRLQCSSEASGGLVYSPALFGALSGPCQTLLCTQSHQKRSQAALSASLLTGGSSACQPGSYLMAAACRMWLQLCNLISEARMSFGALACRILFRCSEYLPNSAVTAPMAMY